MHQIYPSRPYQRCRRNLSPVQQDDDDSIWKSQRIFEEIDSQNY
jgi:hypothetical protein